MSDVRIHRAAHAQMGGGRCAELPLRGPRTFETGQSSRTRRTNRRMKLSAKFSWTARPSGGLALGMAYHFPTLVVKEDNIDDRAWCSILGINLIFFRIQLTGTR